MNTLFVIIISLLAVSPAAKAQSGPDTLRVKTSAQCEDCQERIEMALVYSKGVKSASLNLEDKVATIVYRSDKTTPDGLRKVIADVGYDADEVPANPAAYSKLPACCKKPEDPDARPH